MYRTTAAQHGEGSGYTRKTESIWGMLEGIRRDWRKWMGILLEVVEVIYYDG